MNKRSFLTHQEEANLNLSKTNECPVCHKMFNMCDDSKYLINNEYTCSWKCFLDYVKAHPKDKK